MATQTWTEQIIVHLDLLKQVTRRMPANERIEIEKIKEIIHKQNEFVNLFKLMLEIHGFNFKTMQFEDPE